MSRSYPKHSLITHPTVQARRVARSLQGEGTVHIHFSSEAWKASFIDLRCTGLFILRLTQIAPGTRLKLEIQPNGFRFPVKAEGIVRRVRNDGTRGSYIEITTMWVPVKSPEPGRLVRREMQVNLPSRPPSGWKRVPSVVYPTGGPAPRAPERLFLQEVG